MKEESKVLVLGSRGLVGSSLVRELKRLGYKNVLAPTREELDLSKQNDVLDFFNEKKPEYVFMAAGKVGGIKANNTYSADFIFQNLSIQNNVFEASFKVGVEKLLFTGSSCIYPKNCPQPIKEEYLLTGELEPTNEPYAIAKIAGLKTVESFRRQYGFNWFSVMPTNLYGPNDNFHPEESHVIPGMIQRMKKVIENKEDVFEVWGSGNPKREFLFVDDLAKACLMLMKTEKEIPNYLNIGTGEDIAIKDLAETIAKIMGFKGKIVFNRNYPDGTMRKVLDVSKIKNLGWRPQISLGQGLKKTIESYKIEIPPKEEEYSLNCQKG
jgi:GDP-L-fucose synthase